MSPLDSMEALEDRLAAVSARGINAWRAGARLISQRMGLEPGVALEGTTELGVNFARVVTAEDPRRFRVAGAAEREQAAPAMVLFCGDRSDKDDLAHDDLLALSLKPGARRFWRMTCACDWLGLLRPDASGTLRLRQDAHLYVGSMLKAAAFRRRGREEGVTALEKGLFLTRQRSGLGSFAEAKALPAEDGRRVAYLGGFRAALEAKARAQERWRMAATWPAGALILDPVALEWTRRGVIGDAEWIEIMDAPADGPLGRALKRLNPRIGSKHGVPLSGLEPERGGHQRRAAA